MDRTARIAACVHLSALLGYGLNIVLLEQLYPWVLMQFFLPIGIIVAAPYSKVTDFHLLETLRFHRNLLLVFIVLRLLSGIESAHNPQARSITISNGEQVLLHLTAEQNLLILELGIYIILGSAFILPLCAARKAWKKKLYHYPGNRFGSARYRKGLTKQ